MKQAGEYPSDGARIRWRRISPVRRSKKERVRLEVKNPGVICPPLVVVTDQRGWLVEIFRQDETAPEHIPVMAGKVRQLCSGKHFIA